MHSLQNILVVVNPQSGNGEGQNALRKLETVAAARGCELKVFKTQYAGHAVAFIQTCDLRGVDAVLSVGGDGTLHEVLNGILSRETRPHIPLGILPAGTGNSLMKHLNSPTTEKALEDIFSGIPGRLDVFKIEMDRTVRYGFNMVGCGIPATVNEYAESMRKFKRQRYNLGAIKAILRYKPTGYSLRNESTGKTYQSDFILASNTRFIASGLEIAPNAQLDDGMLDVVFLTDFNRFSLISLFYKLSRGRHLSDKRVKIQKMNSLRITSPSRKSLNIDGEQLSFETLKITVLTEPVKILHPADTPQRESI